jgi:GAF domain-containing protein
LAEELIIPQTENKEEKYRSILPQISALTADESDTIANMANVAAVLKEAFGFFWVGFYIVKNELVLGPFQGPLACTRIQMGKGVCGTAWKEKKTQLVPDVDQFPGHIACSSASRSEIVVPGINKQGKVDFVLDVDSALLNDFDQVDQTYLEEVVALLIK